MSAEDPENIENRLPDPHGQNNNSDTDSVTSHSKCDKEEIKWLMAACNCEQEALTKLLQHRPELVNWQSFVDGYTALHYAAKFGSTGIVKLLLGTYKANVNIVNHAGETPLHVAYYYNQDAVKDQLEVQYRANTQVFDYSGLQPKDHRTKRLEDDRKYNPCALVKSGSLSWRAMSTMNCKDVWRNAATNDNMTRSSFSLQSVSGSASPIFRKPLHPFSELHSNNAPSNESRFSIGNIFRRGSSTSASAVAAVLSRSKTQTKDRCPSLSQPAGKSGPSIGKTTHEREMRQKHT